MRIINIDRCFERRQIGEISEPAFFEMVRLIAQVDPGVRDEILNRLTDPEDLIKFHSVPQHQNLPNALTLQFNHPYIKHNIYYKGQQNIRTDRLRIHFVQDVQEMDKMIDYFNNCRHLETVGFDAEWNPRGATVQTALFQISTQTDCFLVDTKLLCNKIIWVRWDNFLAQVSRLTKLGFSPEEDLERLAKHLCKYSDTIWYKDVIDLHEINCCFRQFLKTAKSNDSKTLGLLQQRVKYIEDHGLKYGLNSMVYLLFGKELDKREQISVWEQRPLRVEQAIYAALDAYSLVDIYSRLTLFAKKVFGFSSVTLFFRYLEENFPKPAPKIQNED